MKPCKDCDTEGIPEAKWRPTPWPGPRCTTHHRAVTKARKLAAHGKRTEAGFGISSEEYWAIHAAQGGKCYICQKSTGAARRLAVDHDHVTGAVRGLLCGPCNLMIGRIGVAGLVRALEYLHNHPATEVIGCRTVPLMDARGRVSTRRRAGAKLTTTDIGEPDP